MTDTKRLAGRPRRFAKFEQFEAGLPRVMTKRPSYCDGIGIFHGAQTSTVWVKIRMPRGGVYNSRTIPVGGSLEHKLGKRSSWSWSQLIVERDRLQGLADRGEPLQAARIETFQQYATEWLKRKKPTLKGYGVTCGHIKSALNPSFGKKALNAISVTDVNRWIGHQRERLAPSTVQRQLSTFNAIMNDAVRSGVIERNPYDRADRIKGIEPRQRFITDLEWDRILATADLIERRQYLEKALYPQQIRGWLKHYVNWAYNSGMRRAEILSLRWNNVRQIDAEQTVVEVGNTKTGKPRFVTCTVQMKQILTELMRIQRVDGDTRLFPVSMPTLKRALTRLWHETGLEDVRLHDLRRTHATILLSQNVDPRTVAGRLGHSGTGMLARHYAVDRGDMDAARVFDTSTAVRTGAGRANNHLTTHADDDDRGIKNIPALTGFDRFDGSPEPGA